MSIYHYSQKSIKCGKGKSAIQHASYISGERLQSERTGQIFAEKKSKGHIVHSELSLPTGISYTRSELWNFCENTITTDGQNWAKWGDFALPVEWSQRECIDHAREFLEETYVKKGYAVDWSLHNQDGNPHIDYMVSPRAFKGQDKFAPNEKKVYANTLDAEGKPAYDPAIPNDAIHRIPVIDPKTGEQKLGRRNEKMWQRVSVRNDGISSKDFLLNARRSWQDIASKYLEPADHIDCRSNAVRGIDQLPGIHIGPAGQAIQERAVATVEQNPEAIPEASYRHMGNQNIHNYNLAMAALRARLVAMRVRLNAYTERIAQLLILARPKPKNQPAVKPWTPDMPMPRSMRQNQPMPKAWCPPSKHSHPHKDGWDR